MVSLEVDVEAQDTIAAAGIDPDEVWSDARRSASSLGECGSATTGIADIRTSILRPNASVTFATMFIDGYLTPAFGARTKSEIDLLVLKCLIAAGTLDPAAPVYDLARALNLTPTRVRSLILNWQLRSSGQNVDMKQALVQALARARFAKDGAMLTFGIENPLLREEVEARLKQNGVFADASFSREIVRLPVDAFVEFLDELVDEKTKRELGKRLVQEHQLPDRSFRALVAGVLCKLGEKIAGKAGEALAGELFETAGSEVLGGATHRLGTFLSSLFRGDASSAASAVRRSEVT